MEDNGKYLPGERNLYEKLTSEEKQEWDSLGEEDRKTCIELAGNTGNEIISELNSIKNKMEYNYQKMGEIDKNIRIFNKKYNLFGF